MEREREVFLFGAGAVLEWGAPTTANLTLLLRESGFTLKNSNLKITEFIYQRLFECGYKESEINFETIINVIEELIVYYSAYNKKSKTPSILKAFLSDTGLSQIFNYSIKGGIPKNGYQLQIPEGKDYEFAKPAFNNENPKQFFLQHLISLLLTQICAQVSKYSWDTPGHSVIDKDSENSRNFRNWMRKINESIIIRIYTLNYDNLFQCLLGKEDIDCFDGFFPHKGIADFCLPDVVRILTDIESNVHYNLHGSAYWRIPYLNPGSLSHPEIYKGLGIGLPLGYIPTTREIEKGKTLYFSNIVAGYQKSQRSAITPLKQMQFAFDADCCKADKLTIIGYSFSDEHINESIKSALRYNDALMIEIIDPGFIDNEMDIHFGLRIFPFVNSDAVNPKKVAENRYSYFDGKFRVYTMGFHEYIRNRANTK